jgi:hypothetical protein
MDLYTPSPLIACGNAFSRRHPSAACQPVRTSPNSQHGLRLSQLGARRPAAFRAALCQTEPLVRAQSIMRMRTTLSCVVYPLPLWFPSLYAGIRHWHRWLMASTVVFGGLLLVNQFGPTEVVHDPVVKLPDITTSWGERVHAHHGNTSRLFSVYFLAKRSTSSWTAGCCVALWRRGPRERAWPLTVYLANQTLVPPTLRYS